MADEAPKKPTAVKTAVKVDKAPEAKVEEAAVKAAPSKVSITYPAKVKNLTKGDLNLTNGKIKPGQTGLATRAEISTYIGKYLELV